MTVHELGVAIHHTFARRGTALPSELPEGLMAACAKDPTKRAQWRGFVRKSRLDAPSLAAVVDAAARLAAGGLASVRDEEWAVVPNRKAPSKTRKTTEPNKRSHGQSGPRWRSLLDSNQRPRT